MSRSRVDVAVQQHPTHEAGIRLLAERDPSGSLKYLNWSVRVLASGQALAPEIADVVDMFHQYGNVRGARHARRRPGESPVRPDLYSYRPGDLTNLRDALSKVKRAQEKKRRERDRKYRFEGPMDAEVVYESDGLVVRHVRNKQASAHYGLGTKWCIAMKRESYFEDYDAQNATFFFVDRVTTKGDEFDKVAVVVERDEHSRATGVSYFNAIDRRVDLVEVMNAHGKVTLDVLRTIYDRSRAYPGSAAARVLAGSATAEQLAQTFDALDGSPFAEDDLIEAICCNDAAPWDLLQRVLRDGAAVVARAIRRRARAARHRRRYHKRGVGGVYSIQRSIEAALSIHPQVPPDVRDKLGKKLRQRHVDTTSIRIDRVAGRVGVLFSMRGERKVRSGRFAYRRRRFTLSQLIRRVTTFENLVKRAKRAVKKAKKEKAAKDRARAQRG